MTTKEMAQSYIRTAEHSLKQARLAYDDGLWHLAVRRSQESVEPALKGVLRLLGLEVLRVHDVSFFLMEHRSRFPSWFQVQTDKLSYISRGLRKDRELSLYRDEEMALPPDLIFSKFDAEEALKNAQFVLEHSKRLLEEFTT
ncbi:MAG: HEPN domain-containing protein [Anaerolineae bacterium]|nr:HEPN domain-containing protein [Anaerolineae bacterium]MDW8101584.1 HEPN domain-containing protein [Anaerolineae bacterium]